MALTRMQNESMNANASIETLTGVRSGSSKDFIVILRCVVNKAIMQRIRVKRALWADWTVRRMGVARY